MTEDDIYRSSTQYRLWSFTPEKLSSLRASTHKLASERVKAAFRQQTSDGYANGGSKPTPDDPTPLALFEELAIVQYYASQASSLGSSPPFSLPPNVIATAIQYTKRFYLSNSPQTYHPRPVMLTCLYLATKTEPRYVGLEAYVKGLGTLSKKPPSQEDILALEFLVSQGLRFTFDVKHSFRGLRGLMMELYAMAEGSAALLPGEGKSAQELKSQVETLAAHKGTKAMLDNAYAEIKRVLNGPALTTDAYFFYTPSQILFAAMMMANKDLATLYLDTKFPSSASEVQEQKIKLLATIRECAEMLRAGPSFEQLSTEQLRAIDKKLHRCIEANKVDPVAKHAAKKRDETTDGKLDESVAKRRKLEREKAEQEGENLFGPSIGEGKGGAG